MAKVISKIITYVPRIGDNHKAPEPEQYRVKLRAATVEQKQAQLRKFIDADPQALMKQMMDKKENDEIAEILKQHVHRFEGIEIEEEHEATGRVVKRPFTVKDMYELGEFELALEIFMHLLGSSQLRQVVPAEEEKVTCPECKHVFSIEGNKVKSKEPKGEPRQLTHGEEKEDEIKNSESLSGTMRTPSVM
jgi:hypothetical protein